MKLLLIFTYNRSVDKLHNSGKLIREIALYEKLLEKGISVSFLTFGDKKDLSYAKKLKKIDVIPAKEFISSRNSRFTMIKSLFIPIKYRKIIRNVEIIKTNQLNGSWVTWLAKILYRKKLIVRSGFEWLKFYILENQVKGKRNFKKYWIRFFWRYFIELISYKLADKIILTNPMDIEFVKKMFRFKKKSKKFELFYNYIDVDEFKPINIEKKDKNIIYIGRFHQQKNLFNLILALKDLEDFELDFIGKGKYENSLLEKAEKIHVKLNLLGIFPNNEIPEILNQYQIFILPSYYEGNPKVLLEAMSCGLACIGTNVYGIKNIIKHKENGYLCETNANSINNAIKKLYDDKELRNNIGTHARKFVLRNCSLKSIVEKEFALYNSLLKKK